MIVKAKTAATSPTTSVRKRSGPRSPAFAIASVTTTATTTATTTTTTNATVHRFISSVGQGRVPDCPTHAFPVGRSAATANNKPVSTPSTTSEKTLSTIDPVAITGAAHPPRTSVPRTKQEAIRAAHRVKTSSEAVLRARAIKRSLQLHLQRIRTEQRGARRLCAEQMELERRWKLPVAKNFSLDDTDPDATSDDDTEQAYMAKRAVIVNARLRNK